MPKSKRAIEPGDRLVMHLDVVAVWDDGRITIEIGGVRHTIRADNGDIVEVIKDDAPKPKGRAKKLFDRPDE